MSRTVIRHPTTRPLSHFHLGSLCLVLSLGLIACTESSPAVQNPYANGAQHPWKSEILTARPLKNGFLSDQGFSFASNGWGPVELDASNGEAAVKDGRGLSVGGTTYPKGLGVHASTKISYALDNTNNCTTFNAVVGLDDEIRNQSRYGSVTFQVWTDGAQVWESKPLKVSSSSVSETLSVPISGKSTLELRVTDGGDGLEYDHADWADARVTCGAIPLSPTPPNPSPTPTTPPNADGYIWKPLKVGAGGFITGLDFSSDGSVMIARTDTYGLYRWTGDAWKQLLTTTSLPAADVKPRNGAGVFEVAIAPSDRNRVYMTWRDGVYRSDNAGDTWTKTALTDLKLDANDDWRTWGDKLKVDPRNADVVLVGTPRGGLYISLNAGSSFTRSTSLPAGQAEKSDGSGPGITGIDFDASSAAVSGGRTGIVYASSHKNGVFKSVNGGDTWVRIPGGPGTLGRTEVAGDGTLYGMGEAQAWRLKGGTWTKLAPPKAGDIVTVAVSPKDPKRVITVSGGGDASQSVDSGDSWRSLERSYTGAGDVPWLGWTDQSFFATAQVRFDPVQENRLWTAMGTGVYRTELTPSASAYTWQSQSRGIEQLVGNDVIAPPGGSVVLGAWDFGTFYKDKLDEYASERAVSKRFNSVWQIDYQENNPKFMVGNTSDHRFCCAEDGLAVQAGYSEDGGKSWTRFPSIPKIAGKESDPWAFGFGSIAVNAGNPDNVVWLPTFNRTPYYTLDRGKTWSRVNLPGLEAEGDEAGSHFQLYLNRKTLAADRSQPGTFYLAHSGVKDGKGAGVYRTTDGGKSWTRVYSQEIMPFGVFNATLKSVPGQAGHLFFSSGPLDGEPDFSVPFKRSKDGGVTWLAVPNLTNVHAFGFGKVTPGGAYPAIYAVGYLNKAYGVWRSTDEAASWKRIAEYPLGSLDGIRAVDGDKSVFGKVYVAFGGSGFGYGIEAK